MGIDRLGSKGPPAPPPNEVRGPSRAGETGRPFEVSKTAQPTGPQATSQAGQVDAARPPLERLRAGDITLNQYLDMKVHESTAHLGSLPPQQLEAIRRTLRDRMATDPALVDLVRSATGAAPEPPSDD
jgi:hypothetical protein